MATYVTINKWNAERLAEGPVREGEEWHETATRLYNRATRQFGTRATHIALDQHFPGGGTHHIQFGRRARDGQATNLDPTVIVHVEESVE
jgi:hypothetical protein